MFGVFAIDEPGSSVRALYTTLVELQKRGVISEKVEDIQFQVQLQMKIQIEIQIPLIGQQSCRKGGDLRGSLR